MIEKYAAAAFIRNWERLTLLIFLYWSIFDRKESGTEIFILAILILPVFNKNLIIQQVSIILQIIYM
jgi:hypothetical protein